MCHVGHARTVGLLGLTLDQIEEVINERFGTDETDLTSYSDLDDARLAKILKETERWD